MFNFHQKFNHVRALSIFAAAATLTAGTTSVNAALVFKAPAVTATPGSTGSFDLLITDTDASGSSAYDLAGFSALLSVSGTGIQFTDATTSTATPYVFLGNSFDDINNFTLDANDIFPATSTLPSDVDNTAFQTINPGDTYGIAHISYAVAANATPGPHTLTFDDLGGGTSTSDELGIAIPFTTIDGSFTITTIPEPTTALILVAATPMLFKRQRKI